MYGPTCIICDRGNTHLSSRDWCDTCEMEFKRVMERIKCAESNGVCLSPISCMMAKACVQLRAAITIVRNEA